MSDGLSLCSQRCHRLILELRLPLWIRCHLIRAVCVLSFPASIVVVHSSTISYPGMASSRFTVEQEGESEESLALVVPSS